MRDRKQQHLGVYTKHHGFMTLEGFKTYKPEGKEDKKPEQVTALQFRKAEWQRKHYGAVDSTLPTITT